MCPYLVCLMRPAFLRHPEHPSLREGPAVQNQVILENLYLLECQMDRAHRETLVPLSLGENPVKCIQAVRLQDFRSEPDLTDDDTYGGSFGSGKSRLSITARPAVQTWQTWRSGETGVTFLSSYSRHCNGISWVSFLSRVPRWTLKSRDTLDSKDGQGDDSLVAEILSSS